MKLIAPGWSRRETVKLRRLSLLLVLVIAVVSSGGCEEALAPQITQFVLDPACEVMTVHADGVYLDVQYFARASGGDRFDDPTGTNAALEFTWDFGDGQKVKNKVGGFHRYTQAGSYTVRLTVKDKDGDEASIEGDVFVGDLGSDLDVLSIGTSSGYSIAKIGDRFRGRVASIDVSDVANPVITGTASLVRFGNPDQAITATDLAKVGNYLYVGTLTKGLRLIDLSQFTQVLTVIPIQNPEGEADAVNGVTVEGSTAYLALSGGLMRRLDVTDPANPSFVPADSLIVQKDPELGSGQDVMTQGSYAYIANIEGLKTINLADLSDSLVVGFGSSPGPAVGVAVAGNSAYLADRGVGLGVYDISTPRLPVRTGWFGTDGEVLNIVAAGGRGYLCDATGGFYVLDLGAGNPIQLGYANTPGAANDVLIDGDYAYVANSGGLQIIDVSDATQPTIVGGILTLGDAVGVAIDGTTLYVAYNGRLDGWNTPMVGTLTTPCPSSTLVQEFEWVWTFGDGSPELTHVAEPIHLYAPTATITDYLVKLRVTERQTQISRFDSLIVSIPNY
jgi:hypothetical protein